MKFKIIESLNESYEVSFWLNGSSIEHIKVDTKSKKAIQKILDDMYGKGATEITDIEKLDESLSESVDKQTYNDITSTSYYKKFVKYVKDIRDYVGDDWQDKEWADKVISHRQKETFDLIKLSVKDQSAINEILDAVVNGTEVEVGGWKENSPYYVTVYQQNWGYSPAEGGSYYIEGKHPVKSYPFQSEQEASAFLMDEKMEWEKETSDDGNIYKVTSGKNSLHVEEQSSYYGNEIYDYFIETADDRYSHEDSGHGWDW